MEQIETIYKPLDPTKSQIRLLEIISDDGGMLVFRLSKASLDDNPAFCALSYVWGNASIKVGIIPEGYVVRITTNLESSLRHIRRHWIAANPDHDPLSFRLWADALCINQENLEEGSSQVEPMRRIYSNAEFVLSWLGPEDRFLAFDTIAEEI